MHLRTNTERELRASRRLMSVAEWEIQQILLDIHDGPVQYMYAALSQLDLLRRALEPVDASLQPEVHDRLDRIRRLLEGGLTDVRSFIGAYRAPEFQSRRLRTILEELILQHEAATDISVSLEAEETLPVVDLPIKIALYRVLQEGLSNAYRHGAAGEVVVRLSEPYPATLQMTIDDNGAGFDIPTVQPEKRFGLRGMQDRVEMVGGTFLLESTPGSGTRVTVEVPIP